MKPPAYDDAPPATRREREDSTRTTFVEGESESV